MKNGTTNGGLDRLANIERLCAELEHDADGVTLARSRALVASVLELHATGLARLVELLGAAEATRVTADPSVAGLFLLHGLHPRPFGERARAALAGGGLAAQLVSAEDGHVHVRCAAGARAAVEAALCREVPDATIVEIEELVPAGQLVPVERLRAANAGSGWRDGARRS
jgi:hypothetical protein